MGMWGVTPRCHNQGPWNAHPQSGNVMKNPAVVAPYGCPPAGSRVSTGMAACSQASRGPAKCANVAGGESAMEWVSASRNVMLECAAQPRMPASRPPGARCLGFKQPQWVE